MPRGFLVKRNRKATPVSYRIRAEHEEEQEREQIQRPSDAPQSASASLALVASATQRADSLSHAPKPVRFGNPETMCQSMYSPTRPVSREHERVSLERRFDLGSPVSAESFPTLSGFEAQQHLACAPVDLKIGTSDSNRIASKRAAPDPERKSKPAPKKTKAIRKLQFEDEVTTSPVLGLRIKEGPVEQKPSARSGLDKPLGEFVCRLCGEAYADPFALAQHRCSRIVRVEYRCPECDKAFSCPANLASHRRWHKPKQLTATGNDGTDKKPRTPDDTNKDVQGELERERDTPSPGASESGSGSDSDGMYECQRCARKFKRQAYLKKHVLTHHGPLSASRESHAPLQENDAKRLEHAQVPVQAPLDLSACPVCGETFPSRVAQERHVRVQHASHVYPCKHCPAAFYSSPALTRHINKCHPSENRQVILLQVPVRPAC
ncbi:insulinoma-associated protein 1a [Hemibagrus wyckioides]|uniref:insulinoma-associated protein 1a n=1 Tax=Hemibagrus wyckioides TaxID=337641 RepID=UPI00266D9B5A|nr:insulinoma-associated protein 1a [Hemibagrus wyckioides]